jgi:hypothetical protein
MGKIDVALPNIPPARLHHHESENRMGKYSKRETKDNKPRYKIHPVWAGIGFLMFIIVPIIAGAAAVELVNLGRAQGWPFMNSFPQYLQIPIPALSVITNIRDLPAIATFFLLILFIMTGVLSFGYAVVYRVIGPPRYSPQDEPAPRVRTKKYKR